jgi:carbamoyl-phosphate synthase large subunit
MGGQTALNLAKEAEDLGIWKQYNVRLIGVDIKAIDKAEDREKFRQWMIQLGVPVAPARTANSHLEGKRICARDRISACDPSFIYTRWHRRWLCT